MTVSVQHQTFLLNKDNDEHPQQAVFVDDMSLEIAEWRNKGNQLVDIDEEVEAQTSKTC
jgi:hypothetical protein